MKEYESFQRIGVEPHRAYYIPFAETDTVGMRYGIVDRKSSSKFLSLNGVWKIAQHRNVDEVDLKEDLLTDIPVPSCVQMHGFDQIMYLNAQFPFPVILPHVTKENPCWHYRRDFTLRKKDGERYYLNFEGVDSAFYLYINGEYKGYSQISHATSEFDITDLVKDGVNTIDVVVLKWCISTYLEIQDKFRFSGIFRDVYILSRPEKHITDYRIIPSFFENDGILTFYNESQVDIRLTLGRRSAFVKAGKKVEFCVKNAKKWTAETPYLYTLTLYAEGEKIVEKVGFRTVSIDGKVFKINNEPVKLKGVNRHDFNCKTAATVTVSNLMQDIRLMKYLNVNAVRTSHYPNMPEFYQLCDKHGIYVMDEADLEIHGATACEGNYDLEIWSEFAHNELFTPGITDRHHALVERDKNRSCVIIWSLGNESSFGTAFFDGLKYVKRRDKTRPVHYENSLPPCAKKKYRYQKGIDFVSMMYPSMERMEKEVFTNPKENRPYVLCEYTHAMGNSCGDIAAYWEKIYNDPQMMGAFVWEWADHAIKTKKGFLYGGDFGEHEHDGNFCCDGLLTPDRKLKSNALEMRAVYGGKIKSEKKDVAIPSIKNSHAHVELSADELTGELQSIKVDGKEILKSSLHLNASRYIDNDRILQDLWNVHYRLKECKQIIISCDKTDKGYVFKGAYGANCRYPVFYFTLTYTVIDGGLEIGLEYETTSYAKQLPRVGFEFAIDKNYGDFSYVGFGPYESYIDKNIADEYGYYEGNAATNYDKNYVRPQESGSHYATKYLAVKDLFAVTAEQEFSFSVNPYTTAQIRDAAHAFELPENDFVNVCLDLAMRGIGSYSCGPELPKEYEIPKKGKNVFRLLFTK